MTDVIRSIVDYGEFVQVQELFAPSIVVGVAGQGGACLGRGAKVINAYATATVPLVTVILRKAYGGAYIVMGSKSLGGDFNFAWPGAEIAVLGAEGAVAITGRRELKAAAEEGRDVDEVKNQLVEEYTRENVNPYLSVASGELDAIITPETTRSSIVSSLRILRSKDRSHPGLRRHGNIPM